MPNWYDFGDCPYLEYYEALEYEDARFYYSKSTWDNIIVLYHWNAGSACNRHIYKESFEEIWDSFLINEYPWYWWDWQSSSKEKILKSVNSIKKFIDDNNYTKITVLWESLWSWPASYQSKISNVNNLVLISPFDSSLNIAKDLYPIFPVELLFTENYDNIKYLSNYTWDLHILHWDNDNIINPSYSKNLYESFWLGNKSYNLIESAWHNDLFFYEDFWQKLEYLIK